MIDHLLGRPSTSLKRLQILFIILIWSTVLKVSDRNGPRNFTFLRRLNRFGRRFTPWQIVVSILTFIYAVKHLDSLLGFGAPEPLARMYSRPFYRVTWIVTALDAGFATAMNIQPKWLRDIASLLFSFYYLIYAQEADEKLRKFRAFCTVDMMRATWHKTTNPYIRLVTWFHRPSLGIAREILLPRPKIGPHNKRPTKAWLFYNGSEKQLREELELVLDFPGGGFVCMTPQHHEERLRQLAKEMGKPVLSIDYGKSPEYIFPYALEECFDVYRSLIESNGKIIGMGMVDDKISSNEKEDVGEAKKIKIILSGDSAGGNLATSVMFKIIEYPQPFIRTAYSNLKSNSQTPEGYGISPLPRPIAMLLAYPSLNFEFTAWMKPDHLRVLRVQSEVNLQSLKAENHQSRSSSIKPVEASKEGASAGDEKDSAKTSSKGLSPTRSVSATRSRSRSRRPSLSSPIALLSPKDERSRESVMIASAQESAKGKGRSDHASSSKSNEDSNRPGVERQKSYLSLAGQAQMHLFERARFAEAEDQNDDTSLTRDQANISQQDPNLSSVVDDSYTFDLSRSSSRSGSEYGGTSRWLGRIEGDEVDKTIRSLNDPDFELELKAQNDLEKAQITLAKARELADELTRKRSKGKSGIVKTRLTMTSMSAYYSDRILTQSMMRAMAILYIGGRRQPQFEEDYLLSPIVAPARLLAELPPILFICGEKDPICDDTVVMAGRIREAKLAKQFDLKRRREGASARFGESLRLSSSNQSGIPRDPIEDEEPEDWVQMKILEGWSHGFLQMSSLLPESKQVISFLASWTKETFEDSAERFRELEEEKKITKRKGEKSSNSKKGLGKKVDQKLDGERKGIEASSQQSKSEARSTTEIQNRIEVPISSSTDYQVNQKSINARSDVEDDDDEPLSFKTRRSPVQKHLEISNSSPRVTSSTTPTQSNLIQNGAKSTTDPIAQDPESSIISSSPLQSATVSKLRDQSRSRPRPSSFSKVESRKNSSSILQQNSRPSSIKINLDQESSDEEGPSSMIINQDSLTPSSPTFKRRLSLDSTSNNANGRKFSNGNNDDSSSPSDQYKKLLVEENTLLQRRRFGVANELGQSSSAVHSDDDEDEDRGERDGEDGEGD